MHGKDALLIGMIVDFNKSDCITKFPISPTTIASPKTPLQSSNSTVSCAKYFMNYCAFLRLCPSLSGMDFNNGYGLFRGLDLLLNAILLDLFSFEFQCSLE